MVAPQVVKDYIWQEFKEVYLEDRYNLGTKRWLMQNFSAMKQIQEWLSQSIGLLVAQQLTPLTGASPQDASSVRGSVPQKVQEATLPETKPTSTSLYTSLIAVVFFIYFLGLVEGLRRGRYTWQKSY